jgi:hypothetical protein
VTGRQLAVTFTIGEHDDDDGDADEDDGPAGEDAILELMKETFDARELEEEEG